MGARPGVNSDGSGGKNSGGNPAGGGNSTTQPVQTAARVTQQGGITPQPTGSGGSPMPTQQQMQATTKSTTTQPVITNGRVTTSEGASPTQTNQGNSSFNKTVEANRYKADLIIDASNKASNQPTPAVVSDRIRNYEEKQNTVDTRTPVEIERERISEKYSGYVAPDREQQTQNIVKKMQPQEPTTSPQDYYQSYNGPRPSEGDPLGIAAAMAANPDYVAENTAERVHYPTAWGGGEYTVKQQAAVNAGYTGYMKTEYGGAMGGTLRSEWTSTVEMRNGVPVETTNAPASVRYGFEKLFQRIGEQQYTEDTGVPYAERPTIKVSGNVSGTDLEKMPVGTEITVPEGKTMVEGSFVLSPKTETVNEAGVKVVTQPYTYKTTGGEVVTEDKVNYNVNLRDIGLPINQEIHYSDHGEARDLINKTIEGSYTEPKIPESSQNLPTNPTTSSGGHFQQPWEKEVYWNPSTTVETTTTQETPANVGGVSMGSPINLKDFTFGIFDQKIPFTEGGTLMVLGGALGEAEKGTTFLAKRAYNVAGGVKGGLAWIAGQVAGGLYEGGANAARETALQGTDYVPTHTGKEIYLATTQDVAFIPGTGYLTYSARKSLWKGGMAAVEMYQQGTPFLTKEDTTSINNYVDDTMYQELASGQRGKISTQVERQVVELGTMGVALKGMNMAQEGLERKITPPPKPSVDLNAKVIEDSVSTTSAKTTTTNTDFVESSKSEIDMGQKRTYDSWKGTKIYKEPVIKQETASMGKTTSVSEESAPKKTLIPLSEQKVDYYEQKGTTESMSRNNIKKQSSITDSSTIGHGTVSDTAQLSLGQYTKNGEMLTAKPQFASVNLKDYVELSPQVFEYNIPLPPEGASLSPAGGHYKFYDVKGEALITEGGKTTIGDVQANSRVKVQFINEKEYLVDETGTLQGDITGKYTSERYGTVNAKNNPIVEILDEKPKTTKTPYKGGKTSLNDIYRDIEIVKEPKPRASNINKGSSGGATELLMKEETIEIPKQQGRTVDITGAFKQVEVNIPKTSGQPKVGVVFPDQKQGKRTRTVTQVRTDFLAKQSPSQKSDERTTWKNVKVTNPFTGSQTTSEKEQILFGDTKLGQTTEQTTSTKIDLGRITGYKIDQITDTRQDTIVDTTTDNTGKTDTTFRFNMPVIRLPRDIGGGLLIPLGGGGGGSSGGWKKRERYWEFKNKMLSGKEALRRLLR
jgi:hypothetical protein